MNKQLYELIIAPGTEFEEKVYADSFKYNEEDDTYTYHLVHTVTPVVVKPCASE